MACFWSGLISSLYLWTNTSKAWCHKTGSSRRSCWNLPKSRFICHAWHNHFNFFQKCLQYTLNVQAHFMLSILTENLSHLDDQSKAATKIFFFLKSLQMMLLHSKGYQISQLTYLIKWQTQASTTLYGRAYFLSKNILKNIEFAPEQSISAIFSIVAAECRIGMWFFAITEPTIIASRRVHVPDCKEKK